MGIGNEKPLGSGLIYYRSEVVYCLLTDRYSYPVGVKSRVRVQVVHDNQYSEIVNIFYLCQRVKGGGLLL